jgi:rhomboid-like protein
MLRHSHYGTLHFLFNNIALWSFGVAAFFHPAFYAGKDGKGKHSAEASVVPHVMAFFATAGILSAVVSHMVTAVRFRGLAARHGVDLAKFAIGRKGSLGASGAVYSLIVMTAIAFPEAQVS